jgi:predicted nucleic acid-binding protein
VLTSEDRPQAIQLALELALPLLIEEAVGRRVAQGMSIPISGIAGQVLKAFRRHAGDGFQRPLPFQPRG